MKALANTCQPLYGDDVIARFLLVSALVLLAPASWAQETGSPQSPTQTEQPPKPAVEVYQAEVVATFPHDPKAFTQGLLWHDGWLYESTGRVGSSSVRKVNPQTGEVAIHSAIPFPQFGEGLAIWDDELISLTWRSGFIHRWGLTDITLARSDADYPFQGWGLSRFDQHLVASDGTEILRFLDPNDYSVQRTIKVTLNGQPLPQLNELEVVNGVILANVWKTDFIAGIDPQTGAVRFLIDCRTLPKYEGADREAVLNGIAWDAEGERLLVTGKLWPRLYEIQLKRRQPQAQGN